MILSTGYNVAAFTIHNFMGIKKIRVKQYTIYEHYRSIVVARNNIALFSTYGSYQITFFTAYFEYRDIQEITDIKTGKITLQIEDPNDSDNWELYTNNDSKYIAVAATGTDMYTLSSHKVILESIKQSQFKYYNLGRCIYAGDLFIGSHYDYEDIPHAYRFLSLF